MPGSSRNDSSSLHSIGHSPHSYDTCTGTRKRKLVCLELSTSNETEIERLYRREMYGWVNVGGR